jgi:hypothetical protein
VSDLGESLTYKFGPLPAWAWGVGLGGSIIAYRTIKARLQPPTVAPTPAEGVETDALAGVGVVAPDGWTGSPMGGGSWVPAPSSGAYITGDPDLDETEEEDNGAQTNDQWRRLAADYLISTGLFEPNTVNDALVKYLDGTPMTRAEAAVVNAANRQLGIPPDGAPPIVLMVDPAPAQPAPTPVAPTPVAPTPQPAPVPAAGQDWRQAPTITEGSTGFWVDQVHKWLAANTGRNLSGSTYTPATGEAVRDFHRFMSQGTDHGYHVDQHWWSVMAYVSQLNGTPEPGRYP